MEASRDLPTFFDTEVLPEIDRQIQETQQNTARNPAFVDNVVRLELERDKILRVLGRNPTAGLNEASVDQRRQSSNSRQCAVATFRDIGGHEEKLRAAQRAIPAAVKHQLAVRRAG